jgi:hypothetical protein
MSRTRWAVRIHVAGCHLIVLSLVERPIARWFATPCLKASTFVRSTPDRYHATGQGPSLVVGLRIQSQVGRMLRIQLLSRGRTSPGDHPHIACRGTLKAKFNTHRVQVVMNVLVRWRGVTGVVVVRILVDEIHLRLPCQRSTATAGHLAIALDAKGLVRADVVELRVLRHPAAHRTGCRGARR